MNTVIGLALITALLGYTFMLPVLDRLPAWVGWEDERGAISSVQHSKVARLIFCGLVAAAPVLVAYSFGASGAWWWALVVFFVGMTAIAWIDLIEHIVPEVISIPLLLLGICFTPMADLRSSILGAVVGGLFTLGTMFLMAKAKKVDLVAGGDVMLSALGGAWFGFENVFFFVCLTNLFFLPMAALNRYFTREEGFAMAPAYLLGAYTLLAMHSFYPIFS